jgi:hypothetical protein
MAIQFKAPDTILFTGSGVAMATACCCEEDFGCCLGRTAPFDVELEITATTVTELAALVGTYTQSWDGSDFGPITINADGTAGGFGVGLDIDTSQTDSGTTSDPCTNRQEGVQFPFFLECIDGEIVCDDPEKEFDIYSGTITYDASCNATFENHVLGGYGATLPVVEILSCDPFHAIITFDITNLDGVPGSYGTVTMEVTEVP